MMPCEIAVKSLIPAMRAYVAKELTSTHHMKQEEVASILGISQAAISKYVSNVRGQAFKVDQTETMQEILTGIASEVALERIAGPKLALRFCEACRTARQNGLMCPLCERYDQQVDMKACSACKTSDTCSIGK